MLGKLRLLLGNEDEDEEKLAFMLDAAVEAVLSYCGIESLPKALENTVVLIAADMFKGSEAKSISEGDIRVDFAEAEQFAEKYRERLARYKRLLSV